MGTDAHRAAAAEQGPITVGVDDGERLAHGRRRPERRVAARAHRCGGAVGAGYRVVRDEPDEMRAAVDELVAGRAGRRRQRGNRDLASATRPTTRSRACSRRPLPGFGELFRMLSWEQVGSAAMLSRATAGTYRGAVVDLSARLAEGGPARVGEADRARARAPRLGGRPLDARGKEGVRPRSGHPRDVPRRRRGSNGWPADAGCRETIRARFRRRIVSAAK